MELKLKRKVRKIGDSLVITIPSEIIDNLKIKEGDIMLLDVQNETLTAQKEDKV